MTSSPTPPADSSADPRVVDLVVPEATVAPGGWEPLAELADEHAGSRLHFTAEGFIRLHLTSHADATVVRQAARSAGFRVEGACAVEGEIGWLAQEDGSVNLGAGLHQGELDSHLARMLDVIEAPVTVCRDAVLQIEGLSEAIAEQVVRVLAPLGFIFDADSELLR